jgi:predicted flap endonuclease-1-like 5' DNA nuclease
MPKIGEIESIGAAYAKKLADAGIRTSDELLNTCATPKQRKDLAEKTGIAGKLIIEWTNLADLFRIKGVSEQYSDLLEEAGVDTVAELAKSFPENLHGQMLEINTAKSLVKRPPTLSNVKAWVEQAKSLPRKIEY